MDNGSDDMYMPTVDDLAPGYEDDPEEEMEPSLEGDMITDTPTEPPGGTYDPFLISLA